MKAYHVQQPETKTDYYTTDILDILNELDNSSLPYTITGMNISVFEFNQLVKANVNGPTNANQE